jgi:HEAT repeat protein
MSSLFKFLLHLTLGILFTTVSIVAQAKDKDFENKEQNKLQKEIKIIRLMIKTSTWREAPYNIQDLIWNKLTTAGFKVVSDASEGDGYDATMNVDYKESKGREYGFSFGGGTAFGGGAGYGTNIECSIRLEYVDRGIIFKKYIEASTSYSVKGSGLYEDAIKNFKEEPYIKYLGNFIQGKLGNIEHLIGVLRDENPHIKESAVKELDEIDPKWSKSKIANKVIPNLVTNLNNDNARTVIEILARIGDDKAVETLVSISKNKTLNAFNTKSLMEALDKIHPNWPKSELFQEVIPNLINGLNDDNATEVVEIVVRTGNDKAVATLISILKNKLLSAANKTIVLEALYKVDSKKAVSPLISALYDDHWYVRKTAIETLEKIGDTKAVEPLITLLKDKDERVRGAAAIALGNISDARAVVPLIKSLKDDEKRVRWEIVEALGKIGDIRAIEALEEIAQNDPSNDVRQAAADALLKIKEPVNERGDR